LPLSEPGAVWLFGLIDLMDESGDETLVAHYSRHLRLGEMVEHGIATFDDATQQFQIQATFDLAKTWQVPAGQAFRHQDDAGDFVYFADPFPVVRVPARLESFRDQQQYEALCWDQNKQQYRWQRELQPITQADERKLMEAGQVLPSAAHFQILDQLTSRPVTIHRGSVNWNAYRQRWVLIGCETNPSGQPSHLGEVWYAEADSMTGPWTTAVKIATHPGYSFYNPRQHVPWDRDEGRYIYFEGTYTKMFSGTQTPTPRYEYNQLLYRLDLQTLIEQRK
jgi:hypothetical protein